MIPTTPFPEASPATLLGYALADAMNRRLMAEYNRPGPLPRELKIRWFVQPARDVVVRYARRSGRFSLEFLRWQRLDRPAMRRRLRENLEIDRRQARTLARRLGRLQARAEGRS